MKKIIALLCVVLFAVHCGGGGGSDSDSEGSTVVGSDSDGDQLDEMRLDEATLE